MLPAGRLWLRRVMSGVAAAAELPPPARRWLVAGLGNYGMQGTRHNVGMAVLNQLARRLDVADQWKKERRCCADLAVARVGETELLLLNPRRLMNVNGHSVAQAAKMYTLQAEDVYLVHDELDKPLGKLAMKLGGSARGHNGVRSCINCFSSDAMPRLRVGIGRPTHPEAVERYVLGRFTEAERERLPRLLDEAAELLLSHILQRSPERTDGTKGPRPSAPRAPSTC
ncbi:probable peptidyl-tRNA hydrolase isoform X1 [Ornithorhynchus anatinus]|uniref:peptidyl-tRNA hydrolase n=1 Tax=Ornithorhynchus anatinus TaxID=9258 RepID=A0A6I8PJY4_ORNAN|nr:probable peptidyl-tRNA hydrolase isoform X1 [Ornithorhynchus anatinus]